MADGWLCGTYTHVLQGRSRARMPLDRIICLLCVYICHHIFPFYYLYIFFSALGVAGEKRTKNNKCPNNKKEIYNDK